MKKKKYDYDSFQLYTIELDKFKNCFIEVTFRGDVRESSSCIRNFLSNYMILTTEKYSTRREMMIEREELYQIELHSNVFREGYNLFTTFYFDFLHPKYVKDKNYLNHVLDFIMEILLKPNFKNHTIEDSEFSYMKEHAHTQINQYKESPYSYAMVDSLEELFPNSISGKRILGTNEELEAMTKEDVINDYHFMFENSYCEIGIIGDLDMDEIAKYFKNHFYKPSIVTKEIPFEVDNPLQKPRKLEKESPYSQTQLIQFYQLDPFTTFEEEYVSIIFEMVLGNAELSDKLAKYLRGEESLCYYSQFYVRYAGKYAATYVGLNKENVSISLQKIKTAMKEMFHLEKERDFIEEQKTRLMSYLELKYDSSYDILENYYFHEIKGTPLYEEYKENIAKVTVKDLENLAHKFHESLLYILKEKEGEQNEEN